MFVPEEPQYFDSGTSGALPVFWGGPDAPDGDAGHWITAPLGSLYVRITSGSVNLYLKKEANSADADWKQVSTA